MKFGEKYELLESLTTGSVETFVANDKVRGERVLVHILDCGPQKANQPTVQWVLEAFRRVAPEPAGLVLETGRYSGTLYAYLVTKMPDDASLSGWRRQYIAQTQETQEIPRPPSKPTRESEATTAELRTPPREPGAFTQAFRAFEMPAVPPSSSAPPPKTEQPPPPAPDVRTVSPPTFRPAPPLEPIAPIYAPPSPEPQLGGSTDLFRSDFGGKETPQQQPAAPGPQPGEFTSFFQGPFSGERSSPVPAFTGQEHQPAKPGVGEFTAIFGATRPEAAPSAPAPSGDVGSFTKMFPDMQIPKTPGPPAPSVSPGLPRPLDPPAAFVTPTIEPIPSPPPAADVAPHSSAFPVSQMPAAPAPERPRPPMASSTEGATRAFSYPELEPAPMAPVAPSGPGEYTRIISSAKSSPPAGGSAAKPSAPAASSPAMPAMAAPPMPAAPAAPKAAAPAAPKGTPKLAVPPVVSYWPLVLTLTGLSFIAVLMVLYFALKH